FRRPAGSRMSHTPSLPDALPIFLVARLMETWAHGTDVADALGASLPVTNRLFHIADLGVRTFSWSFNNRQLAVPEERVRVELVGDRKSTRLNSSHVKHSYAVLCF